MQETVEIDLCCAWSLLLANLNQICIDKTIKFLRVTITIRVCIHVGV